MKKNILIIPAGGSGKRFGGEIPKQYIELCGIPIICRTLLAFSAAGLIDECIIAADPAWHEFIEQNALKYEINFPVKCVQSGNERQDSVMSALVSGGCENAEKILIHDAVRPFASKTLIKNVIDQLNIWQAVIPVLPVKDTIKIIDRNGFSVSTPDRSELAAVQTPEGFRPDCIIEAYRLNLKRGARVTDDASFVELMGEKVKTIRGETGNFKITDQTDFSNSENILRNFNITTKK